MTSAARRNAFDLNDEARSRSSRKAISSSAATGSIPLILSRRLARGYSSTTVMPEPAAGRAHRGERLRHLVERDAPPDELDRPEVTRGDGAEHRRVLVRGHAVAAEDLELAGDDGVHGHRGERVVAEHEPDLHVTAALLEAPHRRERGLGAAERVDRHVDAAAGCLEDPLGGALAAAHRHGAELLGGGERRVRDIDPVDRHAGRDGDHDRREPDAAASVHRDLLAGGEPAARHDRTVGGREAASERRGLDEAERVGQPDEVEFGLVDRDVLGERAPVREAGLRLRDRRPARCPSRHSAQRPHAQMNGAVTRSPTFQPASGVDVGAELGDLARELVAGHVRQRRRCRRGPSRRASRCGRAPVARTRITAPRGGHSGSGTSASSGFSPKALKSTARTGVLPVRVALRGFRAIGCRVAGPIARLACDIREPTRCRSDSDCVTICHAFRGGGAARLGVLRHDRHGPGARARRQRALGRSGAASSSAAARSGSSPSPSTSPGVGAVRPGHPSPRRPAIATRHPLPSLAAPGRSSRSAAAAVLAYQPAFFAGTAANGVAVGTVVALGSAPVITGRARLAAAAAISRAPLGSRDGHRDRGRRHPRGVDRIEGLGAVDGARRDPLGLLASIGAGASYAVYTLAAKALLDRGWTATGSMGALFGVAGGRERTAARDDGCLVARHRARHSRWRSGSASWPRHARVRAVRHRPERTHAGDRVDADPGRAADRGLLGVLVLGEMLTAGGVVGLVVLAGGIVAARDGEPGRARDEPDWHRSPEAGEPIRDVGGAR